MIRRVFSLLLIPLMLAQSLGFAHSHEGTDTQEPGDHRSAHHFHFPLWPHHHEEDDHDSDQDDSDDHDREGRHEQQLPLENHDSDAVYCPTSGSPALVGLDRGIGSSSVKLFVLLDASLNLPFALLQVPPSPIPQRPSYRCAHCPVYLMTLSLLI